MKVLGRFALAAGAFALIGPASFAQSSSTAPLPPQPMVRAYVEPDDHIVVGQPVRLVVEVLVPNYFTGSPQFPDLEIKNAIVVSPQERAQNFSERTGAVTYAGIRQTYFVYTEQPGSFRVPHAEANVKYADAPPHSIEASVPLPPVKFHAEIPAAAAGMSYFLPTTKLVVEQKWNPALRDLHAGQTVERTITITAEKLQGMFVPPIPLDAPDGLRAYLGEPVVEDRKTDSGDFLGGRRVEAAKYLIQKPGDYNLPPIQISWWDLTSSRLRTEVVPGVHFTAAPDPNAAPELPPAVEPATTQPTAHANPWRRYWMLLRANWYWLVLAVTAVWLIARRVPHVLRWVAAQRETLRESEAAYFHKMIRDCERNDAHAAYAALLRWIERAYPGRTVEEFIAQSNDGALPHDIWALGAALYSPAPQASWNGRALAQSLQEFRRRTRQKIRQESQPLPELNPASGKRA